MRTLVLLVAALALTAPLAVAQEEPTAPAEEPVVTEPVEEEPVVTEPGAEPEPFEAEEADGDAAAFGMAWWAWLLLALIVVGVIAAIAVAMGSRTDRTVVEREYRPPPP